MEPLNSVKPAAQKTAQATSATLGHENTKAVFRWIREITNSKLFKDAAAGAAVGALIAVPVPLIGPLIGAVAGAVLGIYKNLTRHEYAPDMSDYRGEHKRKKWSEKFEELRQLDQLCRNGIITEEEFSEQKKEILDSK